MKVEGADARAMLDKIAVGDTIAVTTSDKDGTIAVAIGKADPTKTIGTGERLVAIVLALAIVGLVGVLLSKGKLTDFVLGADNRYSNSKTQLVLWSTTVFVVYLTTLFLRGYEGWADWSTSLGGIEIPAKLLTLSGFSALTYAGAKAVTTQKDASAKQQNAVTEQQNAVLGAQPLPLVPEKQRDADGPAFLDLFQDDNDAVDLGDTQMFLITIAAVVIFALRAYAFLGHLDLGAHVTLPDVDTTLLASFGIGQGAYLAKKAASSPGNG